MHPSCAENKELAEIFINYMLSEEPAVANAEYTYYASPNSVVYNSASYIEEMGAEAMAILYPELGNFSSSITPSHSVISITTPSAILILSGRMLRSTEPIVDLI